MTKYSRACLLHFCLLFKAMFVRELKSQKMLVQVCLYRVWRTEEIETSTKLEHFCEAHPPDIVFIFSPIRASNSRFPPAFYLKCPCSVCTLWKTVNTQYVQREPHTMEPTKGKHRNTHRRRNTRVDSSLVNLSREKSLEEG